MDQELTKLRIGRLSAVLLAGAVLALGACGSSGSKGSASTNAGASGSTVSTAQNNSNGSGNTSSGSTESTAGSSKSSGKLCDTFTVADAAQLFGEPAVVSPDQAADPLGGEQCIYQNKNRATDRAYWLMQVHHYTQAAYFDSKHVVRKTYTNLSGIGDAAFVSPDVIGTGWDVQVKKGNDVYTVDVNASNFGGAKPTVSQAAIVSLVRSKLG